MLHIPPDLTFADLALELDDAGGLHFLPRPLCDLCMANGIDWVPVLGSEGRSMALIAEWYVAHREEGGDPDPAAETIVALLNARGEKYS